MMFMPSVFDHMMNDDFFNFGFNAPASRTTCNLMETDVKEKEQSYELQISLPGVRKEDIKAELKDGTLTIAVTAAQEKEEKDEKEHWIRKERYTGAARRSFFVGKHVEEEDVKAKYENGILTIEVPKAEAKQPKPEERKYIAIEG